MNETPSRVAIHEAAHAIAALHFGLSVAYCTIRPADLCEIRGAAGCVDVQWQATAGHVSVKWPGPDADLEPWCVMSLSGAAAERRQFGASLYGSHDLRHVRTIVRLLDLIGPHRPTDEEVDAALVPYDAASDRLVGQHWPWILAVAEALDSVVGLLVAEVAALKPQEPAA